MIVSAKSAIISRKPEDMRAKGGKMEKPIWDRDSLPRFGQLQGDVKTDVLIIGGGIAGILCAYMLKRAGVDCVLAEAGRICGGVTGRTTAKVTLQHGLIYDKITKRYGQSAAKKYLDAQSRAIEEYRELCRGIKCGYEERDSYVHSTSDRDALVAEWEAICRIGGEGELVESVPLPISSVGAVRVPSQGQLEPLRFLGTIARGLPIYENTKIKELTPEGAITDSGKITAEKTVVATHYPFLNKHGGYFLKLYQHRSYVIALDGAQPLEGTYIDECDRGLSFRSFGELLLLGGGSHRTGKRGGGWRELEAFAKEYYPSARVVGRWATQDCMSLDGIPYVGRYSKSTPNLYVITGFNKWGMTSAMAGAMLLCDELRGIASPYSELFSPERSILHRQLLTNALETAVGLITPTAPRCPHLGCALKYNKEEHSWDCPCHGSRFSDSGKLLDNPATGDLRRTPARPDTD